MQLLPLQNVTPTLLRLETSRSTSKRDEALIFARVSPCLEGQETPCKTLIAAITVA